ncbi:hypothetical protein F4679DRAFT_569071 [Xylaria curta]|nr:hypothetical protein F4679DRAFT_569071 [Xylaria curta]
MRPIRDRSSKVCISCHARKVRCDLQTSPDGVCRNCRRSRQPCIERQGARRRPNTRHQTRSNVDAESQPSSRVRDTATDQTAATESDSPSTSSRAQGARFISHCSTNYYGEYTEAATFDESLAVTSSYARDALLESIQTDAPPRPVIFRAWVEAYMTHSFHHCPVLEQRDLSDSLPSVVLQKAISMVANLTRLDPRGPKIATELYERIKILICMNSELEPVSVLKVLCLLALWNGRPSTPVSVDGPWHWTGVGLRLAIQMGLHRESTYLERADASCLRRMFWFLRNSETLYVSCWGYPPHLRSQDFDVNLPTLDDFAVHPFQGTWFIESSKLCRITDRVSKLQVERRPINDEEFSEIKAALCDWSGCLPIELRLFDANGNRNTYCRVVSELMIQYFVTIVLGEYLKYTENTRSYQGVITSLLAASCGTILYDEIYCRDESVALPQVHGFFCLALTLPLIYYKPQSSAKIASRKRDIEVLRSILMAISDRFGDGRLYLRMIDHLQRNVAETATSSEARDGVPEPEAFLGAHRLFPFPRTFCDYMDLLEPSADGDVLFSWGDWAAPMPDNDAFDFTWLDAFGLGPDNIDIDFSGNVG